jgi:antitoxin YefM
MYFGGMDTTTYNEACQHLARLWDKVIATREMVVVKRRGYEPMALLPAEELAGLLATAHLLRSPRNARRLLESIRRTGRGRGERMTLAKVKERVGLHGPGA